MEQVTALDVKAPEMNRDVMEQSKGEGHRPPMLAVLQGRNFRLRLIGGFVSLLGDQFYLIALPWLVLQLTHNALAMGTVLALAGVPRALFMLLGGALTDRLSPRAIMLGSNLARAVLVALLAALVLAGLIQMWMLYLFAFLFGLVDAFFYPAQNAIVPQLVEKDHLQAGNALLQGSAMLTVFVGPVLAGLLVAVLGSGPDPVVGAAPDLRGIAAAFAVNALGFLVSAATLWMIRLDDPQGQSAGKGEEGDILASIREGLAVVWNDRALRTLFAMVAAINLLVTGPFAVGVPVLADTRYAEGAVAFGIVMSAWGGGSLLGIVLAGALPRPAPRHTGLVLLGLTSTLGIGLVLLGLVQSTAMAALVTAAIGVSNGYVVVFFMTWLQLRTPPTMLGRTMSLLMFASVGLAPVSMALAGPLIELNITALFVGTGILLTVVVLLTMFSRSLRTMEMEVSS